MRTLLFLITICSLCSFTGPEIKPSLMVKFKNLRYTNANLYVSINRKSEKFPHELDVVKYFQLNPSGNNAAAFSISDLPYGKYTITVFQDLNGNKKIDKGFLGIPKEPFAFSNNYRPVFRAPNWNECEFNYDENTNLVEINNLIKML